MDILDKIDMLFEFNNINKNNNKNKYGNNKNKEDQEGNENLEIMTDDIIIDIVSTHITYHLNVNSIQMEDDNSVV